MSEKRRTWLLLGLLAIVAVANVIMRMGNDEFDPTAWSSGDLSTGLPADLQRTVTELEAAPRLSFRNNKQPLEERDEGARNPFIFGVDQRLQQQRQAELEALAAEREALAAVEEQAAVELKPEPDKPPFPGRVLGVMESRRDGRSLSVMIDQEVLIFRPGDIIRDAFRLESIGYQTVRLVRLEDGEVLDLNLETN